MEMNESNGFLNISGLSLQCAITFAQSKTAWLCWHLFTYRIFSSLSTAKQADKPENNHKEINFYSLALNDNLAKITAFATH